MPVIASECNEFLTRVMESAKGYRVVFETKGQAVNFRQRCSVVSNNERIKSKRRLDPTDPMFGVSQFDCVSMVIKPYGDQWAVEGYKEAGLGQIAVKAEEIK